MSTLPLPLAAFFAGLISFLSPCVLPLVPGYLSLISGAGLEELKAPQAHLMQRVMVNSIGFILGFSVVFIALGAAATEIGQVLGMYKHTLARVAGVVIILFGEFVFEDRSESVCDDSLVVHHENNRPGRRSLKNGVFLLNLGQGYSGKSETVCHEGPLSMQVNRRQEIRVNYLQSN